MSPVDSSPGASLPAAPLDSLALPAGLPSGAEIQQIAFVAGSGPEPAVLEVREPFLCRAVVVASSAAPQAASLQLPADRLKQSLALLLVPALESETPDGTAIACDWVEPGVPHDQRQGQLLTLQGTRVVWSPRRAAILAPASRLETLRRTLVDFAILEGELRRLEAALAAAWPELEADTPAAFHFDEQAAARRGELAQRFQRAVDMRTRLARLDPALHRPPVHPVTLAGQLFERLKERLRLEDRVEFVSDQIEIHEQVYELCSQRSSEYALARESKILEWTIILLLAIETIVLLVGLLSDQGA